MWHRFEGRVLDHDLGIETEKMKITYEKEQNQNALVYVDFCCVFFLAEEDLVGWLVGFLMS